MNKLHESLDPAALPSGEAAVPAAAAAAASPPAGAAEQPQQHRMRLIRVKRKRGTDAPDDLVVEGLAAPGKRAHTSLSSAMAGLGLTQQQAATSADGTEQGQEPEAAEAAAQPAARRQRYRRLSTLSAAQLKAMDASQLSSLLAGSSGGDASPPQRRAPVKGAQQQGGSGTAERAAGARQAGAAARYEQIRRRRGLSNFSITEQAADPLEGLAAVVDLVAYPQEDGAADAAGSAGTAGAAGSSGAGASSGFGGPQPQRPSRAQRAAAQYDEGTLLCNYLPMVREYLASQGRGDLPMPGGAAPADDDPMAAADAAEEEGDADEYVYDLYAAVSDGEAGGSGSGAQREAWQELHASGHAPVVQIIDDDTWLVLEAADADDSDADSEDSNAEGFYAHDYPEEESEHSSSDDGYDPEGGTFHAGGRPSGLKQRWRDGDSYGYGSGSDSAGW